MLNIAFVAVGGAIGATARYLVSTWAAARFESSFPYGTLIVNLVGCFIIGAFMTIATERFIIHPHWRLLIAVGFLGGLTTFSSFSFETLRLLGEDNIMQAFANVGLNVLAGLTATWLGMAAARLI